jgi:hypothetical protein
MGDPTDNEKLEAATKAAEAAKAAKSAKAELPPHMALDYTGPLTCEQAQQRHRAHGENLRKPAADVKATK